MKGKWTEYYDLFNTSTSTSLRFNQFHWCHTDDRTNDERELGHKESTLGWVTRV